MTLRCVNQPPSFLLAMRVVGVLMVAACSTTPEGTVEAPETRATASETRATASDPLFDGCLASFIATPQVVTFERALRQVGFSDRCGITLLKAGLDSADVKVRQCAIEALPLFGTAAAPLLPRLRAILRSGAVDPFNGRDLRPAVLRRLSWIDPRGELVLDDLIEAVGLRDYTVACEAAYSLVRLGLRASRAAPAVATLAHAWPENDQLRKAVAQVGGDNRALVAELVADILQHPRIGQLAEELAVVEPGPLPPVATLMSAVDRGGASPEAAHALLLLARHGSAASPAFPVLVASLKSPELNIRAAAAMALGAIGPDARSAVPALCAMLDAYRPDSQVKREHGVCRAVVEALGAIGPDARAALPQLVRVPAGPSWSRFDFSDDTLARAIARIEAPIGQSLTLRVDPDLPVCDGRWLWDADPGDTRARLVPVRTRAEREPDGSTRITVTVFREESIAGNEAVEILLRRQADGTVGVTAQMPPFQSFDQQWAAEPIAAGTLTLRSTDFRSGAPIVGLLHIPKTRLIRHVFAVAFICDDPWAPTGGK